jgi:L-serine deaminase
MAKSLALRNAEAMLQSLEQLNKTIAELRERQEVTANAQKTLWAEFEQLRQQLRDMQISKMGHGPTA